MWAAITSATLPFLLTFHFQLLTQYLALFSELSTQNLAQSLTISSFVYFANHRFNIQNGCAINRFERGNTQTPSINLQNGNTMQANRVRAVWRTCRKNS